MSLLKYITNLDQLTTDLRKKLLELIDDEINYKYPQLNTNNIEAFLEILKDKLPDTKYEGLKRKIEELILNNIEGKQKIEGRIIDVPAIKGRYEEKFLFDKDIYVTGLEISQTGWKKEDIYSFIINKDKILNSLSTKEIGEHKYFNSYIKVRANNPIFFVLENFSGNSRQTILDLEYIEGKDSTTIIKPEIPTIDDIPNDWDVAVVMQWEKNTDADIDLHGVIGDNHVYFGNKEQNNFYLNFDYRQHLDNKNPEIISVKGNKNRKLEIYINNFNEIKLKKPVNIKIYNKRSYGNRLLKEFNIDLDANSNKLKGVCIIDLKTLKIKVLNKNIIGGV